MSNNELEACLYIYIYIWLLSHPIQFIAFGPSHEPRGLGFNVTLERGLV